MLGSFILREVQGSKYQGRVRLQRNRSDGSKRNVWGEGGAGGTRHLLCYSMTVNKFYIKDFPLKPLV